LNAIRKILGSILLAGILLSTRPAAAAVELVVSAASSMTGVVSEMSKRFEARHPDITIIRNFAGTGVLLQQILYGAPVDVFLSANSAYMEKARRQGAVRPETLRVIAANSLVLAVPKREKISISGPADLTDDGIKRIGVGNPATVPAGQYAKQALEKRRLWQPLADKLIFGGNVRQVLDYLRRGEVDAGFVYRTDAMLFPDKITVVTVVDGHDPILYPAAVITSSRWPEQARLFVDFFATPEGSEVLRRYGFLVP